jgi:hypothetical protein
LLLAVTPADADVPGEERVLLSPSVKRSTIRIEGSQIMQDVFYVVITILFFAVAAAFTRGCDKLSEE